MVGVPRSTGCQLCVKRRVKCDQGRPGCGNCAKYGAPCPGFDRVLKFVAGKHAVRTRRQENGSSSVSGSGSGASNGSPAGSGRVSVTPTTPSTDQDTQLERRARLPLNIAPSDDRGQTICAVIRSINQTRAADELRAFAPWFEEVPQHLGTNLALDSAMAAFTLHLLGKAKEDAYLVRESRTIYGQSLGALQTALNHPVEWKSSETLCATMTLSLFELFAGTKDAGSWMKHAAGVSWLMQRRGPDAHRDDWDKSMLLSFRTLSIMNDFFSGQDCFLARRSWQSLLTPPPLVDHSSTVQPSALNTTGNISPTEMYAISDHYYLHLARLPGILARGLALREARKHGLAIDAAEVTVLTRRAEKLRSQFAALFARYVALAPGPVEVPSRDPGSIYDTVLSFENPWHGGFFMSFCASLLILQECLAQCRWGPDYRELSQEYARNIYRSVESVGEGLMGPFRVGYSLRVAYEFADVRTQTWIAFVLARYEKHYASTSPGGYPKPAPNEYQFS